MTNQDDFFILENWALLSPQTQELCRLIGLCPEEKNATEGLNSNVAYI